MSKTEKYTFSTDERYNSHFAQTLRGLMGEHGTTQRVLADFVGIRPQTLAEYCNGKTQPNGDKLLKIAEYYGTTVDFLLTGTVIENIPVYEMLGFSPVTVENLKLVKDGYFEDTPQMLSVLDRLLSDKDFYRALETAIAENAEKQGATDMRYMQFCEANATNAFVDYFKHFFAMQNGGAK